nr:MAG TPA: hypothetical protein [Caudoviricetes sp.]
MKNFITLLLLLFVCSNMSAQLYKYKDMIGNWKCYKIETVDWKTDKILEIKNVNQTYRFLFGGYFKDVTNRNNPKNGELLTGDFEKDGKLGHIARISALTIETIRLYFDDSTTAEKLKNTFKIIYLTDDEMTLQGCEDGSSWGGTLYYHYFKKIK